MLYISKPPFGRSMHKGRLSPEKKKIIVIHSASRSMFVRGRENRPRSIIYTIYIYISERNGSCYVDLPPWGFAIKRVFSPHFGGLCLFTRVYPWLKDTETINVCCDVVSKQGFVAVCKFLITAWNPSRETPSSSVWICQNKTRVL